MPMSNMISINHNSSKGITVQWQQPAAKFSLTQIKLVDKSSGKEQYIHAEVDKTSQKLPFTLTKGHDYVLEVRFLKEQIAGGLFTYTTVSKPVFTNFKAVFGIKELTKLMDKALTHINKQGIPLMPSDLFYRNKPHSYYDYIMKNRQGVMECYTKDNHGDAGNPVNRQLAGLFFATNPDPKTGQPPKDSIFGPVRLCVQPDELFNDTTNLYFSDFYCNTADHYVTLVITKKYSVADQFCQKYLVQLDPFNNQFLCLVSHQSDSPVKAAVQMGVRVEAFYTEDVNIKSLKAAGKATVTTVPSRGQSHYTGIPKNTDCKICNI